MADYAYLVEVDEIETVHYSRDGVAWEEDTCFAEWTVMEVEEVVMMEEEADQVAAAAAYLPSA